MKDHDMNDEGIAESSKSKPRRRSVSFFGYMIDNTISAFQKYLLILLRETEIFLGSALILIGFLGFESDKYCDGNTADYLSCTRPTTYYFFSALDITLIVVGVFFILFWFFKRHTSYKK